MGLILDKIIKANVFEIILSKDKKQLSINELCDGAFETILTKEEAIKMVAEISQEYINQMSE